MNIERWRLILGDASAGVLGDPTGDAAERDDALEWLYGRDPARSAQAFALELPDCRGPTP